MPPAKPPITGFDFHIASATPRPKPSRVDFWRTMVAARWSAFTSTCSPGSSSTCRSGSWLAAPRTSADSSTPPGASLSAPPPPARGPAPGGPGAGAVGGDDKCGGGVGRGGAPAWEGAELLEEVARHPPPPALGGGGAPRPDARRSALGVDALPRRLDPDLLE